MISAVTVDHVIDTLIEAEALPVRPGRGIRRPQRITLGGWRIRELGAEQLSEATAFSLDPSATVMSDEGTHAIGPARRSQVPRAVERVES